MTVYEFGSFDEISDFMAKSRVDAINRTLPWQWAIKRGDHWLRLAEFGGSMLAEFGHVQTDEELERGERDAGASQAEWEYTKTSLDFALHDGFLYSRAYSVIEPDGVLGSTHASAVYPITVEEFEEAKRHRFIPGPWLNVIAHSVMLRIK